jgi:MYXO-CTERM domain-containing protein
VRKLRWLVPALLLAAVVAPAALADGDPASDILITEQLFYPYYSNTPKQGVERLKETIAAANKRGYTIRVAVITSPYDLGAVSALWEKPQPYARVLSQELAFAYKNRLLVVSPKGYGYVEATKEVPPTLALLKRIPIGKGTEGLVASADKAVRLLASKSGDTLPASSGEGGSGSSMDTIVIAIAAAVGAALVVGVELLRRRRRRRAAAQPESAH